jgi:hypothetical protein
MSLSKLLGLTALLVSSMSSAGTIHVESRTSEIQVYQDQGEALSFEALCGYLESGKFNFGKANAVCKQLDGGVIELSISGGSPRLHFSALANATDRLVIEDIGTTQYHYYLNNLGQYVTFGFVFEQTGITRNRSHETEEKGFSNLVLYAGDANQSYEFGYLNNRRLK